MSWRKRRRDTGSSQVLALAGGFLLRYGIVNTPPALLAKGPAAVAGFSPEDGRQRQRGRGADPGNWPPDLQPRSKVYTDGEP